jgi:hypothetical protein
MRRRTSGFLSGVATVSAFALLGICLATSGCAALRSNLTDKRFLAGLAVGSFAVAKMDFQDCLARNVSSPANCEAARQQYESELAYAQLRTEQHALQQSDGDRQALEAARYPRPVVCRSVDDMTTICN